MYLAFPNHLACCSYQFSPLSCSPQSAISQYLQSIIACPRGPCMLSNEAVGGPLMLRGLHQLFGAIMASTRTILRNYIVILGSKANILLLVGPDGHLKADILLPFRLSRACLQSPNILKHPHNPSSDHSPSATVVGPPSDILTVHRPGPSHLAPTPTVAVCRHLKEIYCPNRHPRLMQHRNDVFFQC